MTHRKIDCLTSNNRGIDKCSSGAGGDFTTSLMSAIIRHGFFSYPYGQLFVVGLHNTLNDRVVYGKDLQAAVSKIINIKNN